MTGHTPWSEIKEERSKSPIPDVVRWAKKPKAIKVFSDVFTIDIEEPEWTVKVYSDGSITAKAPGLGRFLYHDMSVLESIRTKRSNRWGSVNYEFQVGFGGGFSIFAKNYGWIVEEANLYNIFEEAGIPFPVTEVTSESP